MLNIDKLRYLHITYSNPENLLDEVVLDFKLRETEITYKWVERVLTAQKLGYPIDDPKRFYGFGSLEQQTKYALQEINHLIDQLENFWRIPIGRRLTDINDQDTLNYLHHIFEVEHGLLNAKKINPQLQKHIGHLNVLVHRCESVQRGGYPRHVVTYYGLPKEKTLEAADYKSFAADAKFGTVIINYVEIGKTLQDLMMDNDSYISPDAFRPFKNYSADFAVLFYEIDGPRLHTAVEEYYHKNQLNFENLGYSWDELSKSIGTLQVADIESNTSLVFNQLETRQFVKAVDFS
jgi:hypothetical protein